MDKLQRLGYTGSIEWFEEDGVYFGKILDLSRPIFYEGRTVRALTADFYDAVDEYLEGCRIAGVAPEKPNEEKVRRHFEIYDAEEALLRKQPENARLIKLTAAVMHEIIERGD